MPTTLPGIVDAHVHLGLVDHALLATSAVVEVHDLGWVPGARAGWAADLHPAVRVETAGPFHTAPGGYPKGRTWAPDASVREITDAGDALTAVADAIAAGACTLKVTLHTGGPRLSEHLLHTLVQAAHAAGLGVSAHAEGEGQAVAAFEAGADVLVHTPWTETLDDATVTAMAARMTWISTFTIHEPPARKVALGNARRFVAAGGRLRYGTDMGNGPTPVGVNEAEILALGEAGLEGEALLTALTGGPGPRPDRLLHHDLPRPHTAHECAVWFSTARRLTVAPAEVLPR
ncbi:amidohydrolase family protein [Kineosporia succinea]|uniref:Imidazolonepropionase-like amidohydrolase n=1 Tax=Kineosporia succinea TaxID=84632 RepID=A0ABT9PAT2_9ACTN|nr:hypothetical protein [Kineosporia succinea]MDP9829794.1 imidazolonepropionase-like amidohydrolase [Kineosporia succinea]